MRSGRNMDLQKYGWRKKQQRERERDAGQK